MFVEAHGKKLHYQQNGTGDPLVIIHGWGSSSAALKELSALLSQNYKTISIDLPGFGKSEMPEKHWGTKEYAETIYSALKKLNINRCHLFGHSFGGAIGIYLSAKYPELATKLVLCAPAYKRSSFSKLVNHKQNVSIIKQIGNKIFTKFPLLGRLYYKIFYPGSDSYRFPQLESNFRKIISEDLTTLLPNVKQPTFILWGKKDSYTPLQDLDELANTILNAKFKTYRAYGHGLPLYAPQKIYKQIISFLAQK